jgi:hypothetical protein
MKIKGSFETTVDFGLLDNALKIRQNGKEIILSPEQAKALAEFINSGIEYHLKNWSVNGDPSCNSL